MFGVLLKWLATVDFFDEGIFLDKMMSNLRKFISWPEIVQKESRIFLSFTQTVLVALQKRRLSLANRRQGMLGNLGWILIPIPEFGFWASEDIFGVSTSMQQRIKSYGERGSPCLSPLDDLNHGVFCAIYFDVVWNICNAYVNPNYPLWWKTKIG